MTEEEKETKPKADRASKMMNDMISGLREFGSAAMGKAEEFGKIATEKAEELTKLGKLKLDIHQLNRSRTKTLAELGELVFNLGEEKKLGDLANHENFTSLVKSIQDLAKEIKEKEEEAQAEDEASGEQVTEHKE